MANKAYWLAQVDVSDPEGYKEYVAANALPFRTYGARFLVRGGSSTVVEGRTRSRLVVIEFKDVETALACYNSLEYKAAIELRRGRSEADVVIVEGYDGPQPTD